MLTKILEPKLTCYKCKKLARIDTTRVSVLLCNDCLKESEIYEKSLKDKTAKLEAQIEKMKSDVIKNFGGEFNVLVARLLKEWEIKEND